MREKGITIEDDLEDFPMQRQNDKPITQSFAEAFHNKLITKREWKRANLCRKYLRILPVFDVTVATILIPGPYWYLFSCMVQPSQTISKRLD